MFSLTYLCICVYCILQLGFLFVMNNRRLRGRTHQEYFYQIMLIITILSFLADLLSTLNHFSAWIFPFAAAGNYIEIILNTILLPIYFHYVCVQINDVDKKLKHRLNFALLSFALICSILVISTAFTGDIFYYDKALNYHRGPQFWIPMTILFVMMLMIEAFIISQRTKIEESYFKSLLFFLLLPLIGCGLQCLILGLPFTLIFTTFAALLVFTNIQNRNMDTDYLTGVFNRQSLDIHMQSKIDASTDTHSFSALLLDLDNFKAINDCYGHSEGDIALIKTAELLRASVGRKNFIARYGGDEFCIIFHEGDLGYLDAMVHQIYRKLNNYNKNTKRPYKLSFSVGYAGYNPSIGGKNEFLKIIDQRMYDDKKSHKVEDCKNKNFNSVIGYCHTNTLLDE